MVYSSRSGNLARTGKVRSFQARDMLYYRKNFSKTNMCICFLYNRHAPREKAKRHPLSFLPFGAGPRNCIGARFAMIEMKIAVAELVRRHVIRPSERNINKLDTVVRTTIMNPANGVWVKLESRQ